MSNAGVSYEERALCLAKIVVRIVLQQYFETGPGGFADVRNKQPKEVKAIEALLKNEEFVVKAWNDTK